MRTYSSLTLIALILLSALGIIAAVQQWWSLALVSVILVCVGSALTTLLVNRYVARLVRTETRKLRRDHEASLERLEQRVISAQEQLTRSVVASQEASQEAALSATRVLAEHIDDKVQETSSHMNRTVRHSTTEIEAMLQLYRQFPELKLPMPESGGWAIDAQSLAYLISYIEEHRPRCIVELGSGTSTVWIAYLCKTYGARFITIDHMPYFLEQTRSSLKQHDLDAFVDSRLAPLVETTVEGTKRRWYDLDAFQDISSIDLLLVDGPPGKTGPQARYPALPQLLDRLAPDATVILDDAHRGDEKQTLDTWLATYPGFSRLWNGTNKLAILKRK